MSITAIYSDMGDVDCASIPLLWKGLPDVNLIRLAVDTDYTKDDIHNAIKSEDDTLIICGHGTPSGLLGYVCEYRPTTMYHKGRMITVKDMLKKYESLRGKNTGAIGVMREELKKMPKSEKYHHFDIVVTSDMAKDFHANRVICVWCHASEFAEANNLYGFWSGMFISNSSEARMCGFYDVPQETIVKETCKFWQDANQLLRNNVPLDQWVDMLKEMGNMNYSTTRYNYNLLRYFPK